MINLTHIFDVDFSILELDTTNNRCEGRRDKYIQQELMQKLSMRTVRQVLTGTKNNIHIHIYNNNSMYAYLRTHTSI